MLDLRPRAEAEALAGAGYSVTLVGGTRDPERLRGLVDPAVGLRTFRLPRERGGATGQVAELSQSFGRVARALWGLARRRPIDVLHAANPPDNIWLLRPLIRVAQGYPPSFVFDQHDVAPVLLREKFGAGLIMGRFERLARGLERASFDRASLIVFANSEYERRAVSESLGNGNRAVVPNGWSLPAAAASPRWRGDAAHLVAYVGAMGEQDCLVHLVDAVAGLHTPGVRVVLAGDGSARRTAEVRAAELGIADRFEWLGWVADREEISSLVRSADVCVAPEISSEFNELASFVKLAEYMSAGAAVVAHPLAQTKRLCAETIGYAVDMSASALAAAIDDQLADSERASQLGNAARQRFEELLRWETVGAPRLVQAYDAVFGAA